MKLKPSTLKPDNIITGRHSPMIINEPHFVNQSNLQAEPKNGQQKIVLGMGCFWGVERLFWQLEGVVSTSVGYSGGLTPNPTYEEVCTGNTGHAEVVRIIYSPKVLPLEKLLIHFWENHDPTQGMRQGNDIGSQYRSVIYLYNEEQLNQARQSMVEYQKAIASKNGRIITTDIDLAGPYYFAENYHQQYLAKNPNGYCGLGGTGICFPPSLT
jgi:peptide-methionine (S)-S-oxide reductase